MEKELLCIIKYQADECFYNQMTAMKKHSTLTEKISLNNSLSALLSLLASGSDIIPSIWIFSRQ